MLWFVFVCLLTVKLDLYLVETIVMVIICDIQHATLDIPSKFQSDMSLVAHKTPYQTVHFEKTEALKGLKRSQNAGSVMDEGEVAIEEKVGLEEKVAIEETVRGKAFFVLSFFLLPSAHILHSLMPLCLEHFSFCCAFSVYKSKIIHFCTPYCYLHLSFVVHIHVLGDVYKFGEGTYLFVLWFHSMQNKSVRTSSKH